MSRKRWVVSPADRELARQLASECEIDSLVALILVSRGITDPFEVSQLIDRDGQMGDPYEFVDMDKAVERIETALSECEKICIYGDYDADGVTSTVMLFEYLKERGADVIYMVPEREEGYGLNKPAIEKMKKEGVTLMVTVDNGISAIDEIEYANTLGIDTVITDHHLPQETLPNAVAIVDPHRRDCPTFFKDYAGAGVTFKLICALENLPCEDVLERYGDLATVGTVADLMPLTDENRLIVRRGLELVDNRVGFSSLLEVAGFKKELSSTAVSFTLAPRLNAAGRVGSCQRAVKLLLEKNPKLAKEIAEDINKSNSSRQAVEQEVSLSAIKIIEENSMMYDRVIVVCGENWHHGIIGIVAARICEKYGRPAIILTNDGAEASGSARSVGEFSLYEAIKSCEHLLSKFGGHAQAAGVSLPLENVDAFREAINNFAKEKYGDMPFGELQIDCRLRPSAFTPELVHSLELLAPFGSGNPVPIFGLFDMKIERAVSVGGGKHTRLELSKEGESIQVMAFGKNAETLGFSAGDKVDLAVTVDVNEYMGREQVTLTQKDIRPSNQNEEQLLDDIRLYERFKREEENCSRARIIRTDVEEVYRLVAGGFKGREEKLVALANKNYAKLNIALDCLADMGVISLERAGETLCVSALTVSQKKNLELCDTFIKACSL